MFLMLAFRAQTYFVRGVFLKIWHPGLATSGTASAQATGALHLCTGAHVPIPWVRCTRFLTCEF
jgi:hypothetical protein